MTACILLIGIGILTIALSVPMYLGKVKRNGFYGFRTPLTLSSDEVWYPSNRYAAITVVIWSVIAIGLGGISLFFRPLSSDYEIFLLLFPVTILVPGLISVRWTKKRF
ncbi:MAG: SdpI family protein [Verrucomicrobiales bacterium]|nr:SdpI family protein [Verrucomicrobiales bacterium]